MNKLYFIKRGCAEKREVLKQYLHDVSIAIVSTKTPSEHRHGTLEQAAEPLNANRGPSIYTYIHTHTAGIDSSALLVTPKGIEWSRKRNKVRKRQPVFEFYFIRI